MYSIPFNDVCSEKSEVNRSNVRRWIPDAPEEIGEIGWWLGFMGKPWENHGKSKGKA
jgi:hypothetical protein